MKKHYLILYFTLFTSALWGQMVSYTVDNYTEKLSPFKPSFTLLGLDGLIPQYGLTLEGAIGKRLGYNFAFRRDYVKNFFISDDELGNPGNKKHTNYIEGSIDFFLTNKVRQGISPLRVVTSSSTYGNYIYSRYFTAYVDKRTQFGLHGGLYYYNTTLFSAADTSMFTFTGNGSSTLPGDVKFAINSRNSAFFAGIVFKKVRKATIHSGGWKYFRHLGRRIYIDALLGGSTLKDINYANRTYQVEWATKSPVGWRMGFEWEQMGTVTSFEFGYRPGLGKSFIPAYNYFNLSFSFNLFNGDKRYAMRTKK